MKSVYCAVLTGPLNKAACASSLKSEIFLIADSTNNCYVFLNLANLVMSGKWRHFKARYYIIIPDFLLVVNEGKAANIPMLD